MKPKIKNRSTLFKNIQIVTTTPGPLLKINFNPQTHNGYSYKTPSSHTQARVCKYWTRKARVKALAQEAMSKMIVSIYRPHPSQKEGCNL